MVVKKVERRLQRWQRSLYRWLWLRREGPAERSQRVFIFGGQRSGTTMLAGCFENSTEFDVYGETSIAFEKNVLKGLDNARDLRHCNLAERRARNTTAPRWMREVESSL